jgi:hypothetical protein
MFECPQNFVMSGISKTLGSYVWWTHERGSLHYDVMVTLILIFVFLAPLKINFKDKPAARDPHLNQITAYTDLQGGVVYEVPVSALGAQTPASGTPQFEVALLQALRPIAGDVKVVRYEAQPAHGKVQSYRTWVKR